MIGSTAELTLSKVRQGIRYKIFGTPDKDTAFSVFDTIDMLGTEETDHTYQHNFGMGNSRYLYQVSLEKE